MGALAAAGAVLVFTARDPLVLRIALVGVTLVAVGLLARLRQREAHHARAMQDDKAARRREQSLFQVELDMMRENVAALTGQIAQLRVEASLLRAEIGALRAEKGQADELVRRLRAARADGPAANPALTPAAFEAAAEALAALDGRSGDEEEAPEPHPDAGAVPAKLSDTGSSAGEQLIDLTPHDDTVPINTAPINTVPINTVPAKLAAVQSA